MSDDVKNNFPPRNLKTDEEILEYIAEHQVKALHSDNFEWFWNIYIPACERVISSQSLSTEIIAENFYAIGDTHDFNNSPRVAIANYKRALKFDPELNAAHREIANMYRRLGFIDAAIHHSNLALALWPDEKSALADRENINADKNNPEPYFEDYNTPIAFARDALAQNDAPAAIKLLEGSSDLEGLKTLTWAYGAHQDYPKYLSTWKQLINKMRELPSTGKSPGQFEENIINFHWCDHFFMPEKICDGPEIWKLWKESGFGFYGNFFVYDGLDNNENGIPTDSNFLKLSYSDRIAKKVEYLFYRHAGNLDGLKKLRDKYPRWEELNEEIKRLEAK